MGPNPMTQTRNMIRPFYKAAPTARGRQLGNLRYRNPTQATHDVCQDRKLENLRYVNAIGLERRLRVTGTALISCIILA